ncbi:thymidylate synthase [Candidatus Viridilinea mediisalina]|uniref:Thymidylate synthase/dCMP hydroxymethylase domain-containing protein n=1 Tax=Candidatus Viridilinea mediisalina TaxID=2024553 RepID=A0A2A6RQ27_9CHLR|nr:thymidylate synthase [Candidatus Viridilinea mediisalina]PDW04989.1 hypothetical protein CJ255_01015 [Candidatus Viridilinea mediisalina]
MTWPIYFASNLTLGNAASGLALCLLWTPQERVVPALDPMSYALVGNLYSRDGVSFLVRNLLAQPWITDLLLCGKDLTGSGGALVAFLRDGLDEHGRIKGDGTRLHPEISTTALELLRRSVRLHDYRGRTRGSDVAVLVAQHRCAARAWATAPLIFPYHEPESSTLPSAPMGVLVRAPTIRTAYLQIIWHVLHYGQRSATQQSSDQREVLDLLTVVSDEPDDPAQCSYADWMPFSRASLGERQADGRYSGYLGQLLHADGSAGLSYTYGARLRAFGGDLDQIAAMAKELEAARASRRAVAVLWAPEEDAISSNPPCLNVIQARIRDERLHLTAYFRSHDIYRAWANNAYGLRALQSELARMVASDVGELAILSHSAHIYAHDWAAAEALITQQLRPSDARLQRDARGAFVILLEPPEIVVRHYSPCGEHLQSLRGHSARELGRKLAPYVGEIGHALYLGQELQKAELALQLGRAEAYHQDQPLEAG